VATYVPIRAVCEKYGISQRAVRRYITEGDLTAYRVGPRLIRLDLDEVEAELLKDAGHGRGRIASTRRDTANLPLPHWSLRTTVDRIGEGEKPSRSATVANRTE
jgi:excisionase family DNA binding protein